MIKILPIQPGQIAAAKMVIAAVAQRIFVPDKTPQEFAEILDQEGELRDVDNAGQVYDGQRGLFLVVLDDDKVVGTGAIKPLAGESAELKRLWLLEQYQGQGVGYRLVTMLFEFARQRGYKRVCLQTSHQQLRAIAFYQRIGFTLIPAYNDDPDDDISMELRL